LFTLLLSLSGANPYISQLMDASAVYKNALSNESLSWVLRPEVNELAIQEEGRYEPVANVVFPCIASFWSIGAP
jgi:hypothetical protein